MNKNLAICAAFVATLGLTGCGPTYVNVPYLKPATIAKMKSEEVIATTKFKNDEVGLSPKVEAFIVSTKVNGQPYFKVVNRSALDQAIKEQGLQSTKYIDSKTAVKVGKLTGATKIIIGNVSSSDVEKGHYTYTERICEQRYKSGECASYYNKVYSCNTNKGTLSATMNLIDVKTGINIHAENVTESLNSDSCKNGFITKEQTLSQMADNAAERFVSKLSPRKVNNYVVLMDEIESIEVKKEQNEYMKNSVTYIEQGRSDKANSLLKKLDKELNGRSYEVIYNIAITEQALGNLEKAKELLTKADSVCTKSDKNLNNAILNIDKIIEQEKAAKKQM